MLFGPKKSAMTSTTMVCPVSSAEDTATHPKILTEDEIDQSKLVEIPQPPPQHYFGLMGHIPEVDPSFPLRSYWKLMDLYGPIFKLNLGSPRLLVGNHELVSELLVDDDRFKKQPNRVMLEMRAFLGDGLFTAYLEEKNWWKAHRLLVPAFGPLGLRKMFDDMLEISSQMILMWDRFGPDHVIDCIEDVTRLTFDTIGLCGFGYRFNEFYTDEPHPFAKQLQEALLESGKRGNRPPIMNRFYYYDSEQHRQENIAKMGELCEKIVRDRIDNPKPDAKDVLNLMLNGVDPETGEKLSVDNIRFQMNTFLGAGYETTSSSLGFTYYFLCNHPDKLLKAQREVDEVVGDKVITANMLPKLTYLDACMKESLRVMNPINLMNRTATKDTTLGGKYFIKKGQLVSGIMLQFHRDRKIWGEDADEFRPERMLNGGFQALPQNSWKPFGDGLRACIGRGFAEQEMLINMAMVLQRFQIEKADPEYQLQLKSTLTIKPVGFKMKARRRLGRSLTTGIPGGGPAESAQKHRHQHKKSHQEKVNTGGKTKPVSVFYGGNTGTSESLARSLFQSAPDFGLNIKIQNLDSATENLPTDKPCIIITPSYEGRPPDNAKKFVTWIEQLSSKSEKLPTGTKYAVFGVGNSDWVSTFHQVPRLIDETLAQLGAERIVKAGFANVKQDLVGPWEEWSEQLCMNLSGTKDAAQVSVGVDVRIEGNKLPQVLGGDEMAVGTVIVNHELADTSTGAAKQHVEVRLPADCDYTSGDYLLFQGRNPEESVRRVMIRFGLGGEDAMSVQASKKDFLPAQPMAVDHFLHGSVELAAPVTKRQLATLALWAEEDSAERTQLEKMQEDIKYEELLDKRYSIIDVLEEVPRLRLPFGVYIDLLQPLTPRQYSISSSPLEPNNNPDMEEAVIASVTFDVFESPATSGHGTFRGVLSSYLANRQPGDRIPCFVRPTNVGFRLPPDTETPVIMLAAGTGIAPMRAFIQERAAIKNAGVRKLGPAVLFFGCRHPDKDYIYRNELAKWEKEGVVEVIPCFSKPSDGQKGRHVPDALWEHRERVWEMFRDGGKIYLCGSAARLGRSSAEMCRRIWREKTGKSELEALEWLEQVKNDRYVSDVY